MALHEVVNPVVDIAVTVAVIFAAATVENIPRVMQVGIVVNEFGNVCTLVTKEFATIAEVSVICP